MKFFLEIHKYVCYDSGNTSYKRIMNESWKLKKTCNYIHCLLQILMFDL